LSAKQVTLRKEVCDVSMLEEENALRRCSAALAQRRPGEAEHIAREVLSTNPQQPAALFFLGVAHLVQGRAQGAVTPLELAASTRPEASIETHLAMALRECGRVAEALTWFERAISRWPVFGPAFQELGATYRKMRRFADAEAVLRRGQALAPAMPDLDVLLGAVCLDRGDPVKAHAAFTRVLAQAPGHPEALFGLGTALVNQGEFVRAADQYRQILARDPAHVRALLHLGHCLMELGQWDEGVATLRAAVKVDPTKRGHVMRMLVSSAHGKFWLRRSAAAAFLDGRQPDGSSVAGKST
jgi:tetratricopeptide (TPR) repeat protein